MLDCGFTVRETERRLARLGRDGSQLSAIVVTHEHGDHLRGVAAVARKFRLPVWMTQGTLRAAETQCGNLAGIEVFSSHQRFEIGALAIQPFPVPHDAREPSQFVFSDGDMRLGVLTDTGSSTRHIEENLNGCHGLLLECNHDRDMLFNGEYPPSLKERVGGPLGHLDNDTSGALLGRLDTSRLQHLVAAHLSEKNNTPYLARTTLSGVLGCNDSWIQIADQERGLPWRELRQDIKV
jgi:phosphoribosyl 1,2-cyclic phosphodiesterase